MQNMVGAFLWKDNPRLRLKLLTEINNNGYLQCKITIGSWTRLLIA